MARETVLGVEEENETQIHIKPFFFFGKVAKQVLQSQYVESNANTHNCSLVKPQKKKKTDTSHIKRRSDRMSKEKKANQTNEHTTRQKTRSMRVQENQRSTPTRECQRERERRMYHIRSHRAFDLSF
jgi:hypothetical protein